MISLVTIFIIAVSVSLDAFAVSIVGGIKAKRSNLKDALKVGLFFGGFQAIMPLVGWMMGATLRSTFMSISGWIAFILLALIGIKMIIDALRDSEDTTKQKSLLNTKTLLLMSIATSIDALVVGVSLSLVGLPLIVSVAIIGATTFAFSVIGFQFGESLGRLFSNKVEIIGGLALIGIGINLLLN